jgi:VanZ family protein
MLRAQFYACPVICLRADLCGIPEMAGQVFMRIRTVFELDICGELLHKELTMKDLIIISRWLLFTAYVLVICWLSLTPAPPQIEDAFFGWDKVQHAGAYGVFTLFAGWAFGSFALDLKRRWQLAVAAAVIFGGLLEIVQGMFTRTRTAEWGDLLADLIGAACAYGLVNIGTLPLFSLKNRNREVK